MHALEVQEIIRVVKKLASVNTEPQFKVGQPIDEICQVMFERQGVNKVINILEGIANGNIKLTDYPED